MASVIVPTVLLCAVSVGNLLASPVRTYDQRQQGELNIHAQLDNIVIVLVPTSNFNLLGLTGKNKFGEKPDKNDILQIFQKPHKNDIDRYEFVKDDENGQNDIKDLSVFQNVNLAVVSHGEKNDEKEEEVVAIVEEMKSETTEKATDPTKSEATEDSPIKEHSTVSETVQESVLKVSVPDELKDKVKPPEETKSSSIKIHDKHVEKSSQEQPSQAETALKEHIEYHEEVPNTNESSTKKESSSENKEDAPSKETATKTSEPEEKKKVTIEDLIKPVAEKEEKHRDSPALHFPEELPATKKTSSLVEGARREKVIKYKPESKWAPGLVDMLTPPRTKPTSRELDEKQRFAGLCAPGTWDTELKTCIMPGETRSRHELAQFLEAMRFGIALPTPQK